MIPAATLSGGGQIEQGHPGKGATPYCFRLTPSILYLARSGYLDLHCLEAALQSCSLRTFLRARLRASAAFTRFFSPGFR
jgi:hypothetical protein